MIQMNDRAAKVRARVIQACEAAHRDPGEVEILAVSKFHPVSAVQEAMASGFTRFGENYVQEGVRKAPELPNAAFLLIGPLQRNKAKPALIHFREILTLDRPELATRLVTLAEELDVIRPVWIQVDLWDEATKMGGCPESSIQSVIEALGGSIRLPIRGFMSIPPPHAPTAFSDLADLRSRWQDRLGQRLLLSMGMSEDLEDAIAAGSNQVRIGTALFGDRSYA